MVNARQGSGKTLAAQRLYQQALNNRIGDHSQPFPIFLNARNINGELKDQIEERARGQANVYTQKVLVIVDGLDETGRHKADQLISEAQSYTEANQNVAAVSTARPLPGLKPVEKSSTLPECDKDELLSIASKVAGWEVRWSEILFRESQSQIPLFAAMVGALLRQSTSIRGMTLSQMVSEMVRRVLGNSLDTLEETEDLLKKLAVASIASGEGVEKALVAVRTSEQALLANSRLVTENAGRFDFTLAIFREWFAARALVEKCVSLRRHRAGL